MTNINPDAIELRKRLRAEILRSSLAISNLIVFKEEEFNQIDPETQQMITELLETNITLTLRLK